MERRRPGARRWPETGLVLGIALFGAVVALSALGLAWTPRDPLRMDIPRRLAPPGAAYPLGSDEYGRDLLSRAMHGGAVSLGVGAGATALAALLGFPAGALAARAARGAASFAAGAPARGRGLGGLLDEALMRFVDALYAFPGLLLALLLIAVLGPGPAQAAVAVGVAGMPVFARLTRGVVLALYSEEFVMAARAAGATEARVLWRHVLPNAAAPLIVQAALTFSAAVLAESALSFLGLGVQPPLPSWGRMLSESRAYLGRSAWPALVPGALLVAAVLGANLLSDGLRDLLDPRLRRARGAKTPVSLPAARA